jgi:Cupin superfamily protein
MTAGGVPTIAAPLPSAAFHDAYWATRQPVVITGTAHALLGRYEGWDAEVIFERMRAHRASVTQNLIWFDTEEGVLLERGDLPDFLSDHIYGAAHLTRPRHYRLFFHARGHTTGLHYEGNLLDVFSYQLKGVRRWKLLRGDRAHKLVPFYFLENQASYAPVGDVPEWTHVVDLQPGELLFLPRGWYHHVECLSDDNVALSLVSAPRDPAALGSLTLDTYREQLALQYHLQALLPARFADKLATFLTGDATGLGWARHYIAGVSYRAMLRRLATDLALVTPRMLASLALDRGTRDYLAYLQQLQAALQRKLDPPS